MTKILKTNIALTCFVMFIAFTACEHSNRNKSDEQDTKSIITQKAFPFIWYINQSSGFKNIIQNHDGLKTMGSQKEEQISEALQSCKKVPCIASAIQWNEGEITEIGDYLISLYNSNEVFKDFPSLLRKDGYYQLFEAQDDTTIIRQSWEHAVTGINHVINVYLKGEDPRYPRIDSISFKVNHYGFINLVQNKWDKLVGQHNRSDLFYEFPLQSALKALEINGRDEPARYEPINQGWNREPYERINDVEWDTYEYSMILVPGQGPQERGIMLDSLGMYKMDLALKPFKDGLAPYLVVSGGHVHPYKTPYCEAVEMKKYLMEEEGISGDKIFIEPYARHTTTNLRNVTRMIYRFGIPSNKPVLIVTDKGQNRYINGRMGDRAFNQLGYRPYKLLQKLDEHKSEFYPIKSSLQADPFDILDP